MDKTMVRWKNTKLWYCEKKIWYYTENYGTKITWQTTKIYETLISNGKYYGKTPNNACFRVY